MGQRREPRKEIKVAIRIFGTDAGGIFSENASTVDVSQEGARVVGVRAQVNPGETVGVTYGQTKGRFIVQWVGAKGTPQEGQLGLRSVARDKCIWDFPLPSAAVDGYMRQPTGAERRKDARLKSTNSVELQPEGASAPIWGKATDLSAGGCFVEMPVPLKKGTKLKLAMWIGETKLWLNAKVVNSRPGFGIGIQFSQMSEADGEKLKAFLKSITRLRV